MPFFDLARVEYTRHLGLPFNDHDGCQFVMRAASVEYHAPARFDDLLEVFVRTRVTTAFAVYRVDDDVLMCVAEQTLVLVDLAARRPVSIQEAYRAPVRGFEGTHLEETAA